MIIFLVLAKYYFFDYIVVFEPQSSSADAKIPIQPTPASSNLILTCKVITKVYTREQISQGQHS